MAVFQTLFVYVFLFVVMYSLCYIASKNGNRKLIYIAIGIYALVFGFRYGVGVDFFAYDEIYNFIATGRNIDHGFEVGFELLLKLMAFLDFPSSLFFAVVAFLQLFFVFRGVDNGKIYSYLIFTFMAGCVWLAYANGLRQQLAFCILFYSLHFIANRNCRNYVLFILLASSVHISAILLLCIYPIFRYKDEWIKNIKIQYILLAISLILMKINIVDVIVDRFTNIQGDLLGYSHYLDNSTERIAEKLYLETKWGIGAYIILLINVVLIYWSNDVKKYYSSRIVIYSYNLFFLGVLWNNLFNNSSIFLRLNYYLMGFQYIIAAYTLMFLVTNKMKRESMLLIVLYLLLFLGYMYKMDTNTALFLFNWQTDMYYLKYN